MQPAGHAGAPVQRAALRRRRCKNRHHQEAPGAGVPDADAKAARAVFRTFDGLELEVTGRKDGSRSLITLAARATAKDADAEAHALNTRLAGWEFEIPEYKYGAIFRTLDDLLQPKPAKPEKPVAKKPAAKAPADSAAK